MKRKKTSSTLYFKIALQALEAHLKDDINLAMNEVDKRYIKLNTFGSSAHIVERDHAAYTCITDALKGSINEAFSYLSKEYIPVNDSDIAEYKELIKGKMKSFADMALFSFGGILKNSTISVRPKRLDDLKDGRNEYVFMYIETKYVETRLSKMSLVMVQSKRNLWFALVSLIISVAALILSLIKP
jgi:hypothetical protein